MSRRRSFLRRIGRFGRDERGSPSVEFVLIFPVFMALFTSMFEAGILMTKHMMLERGVDIAVRTLRLSTGQPVSHDQIKEEICTAAAIFSNCEQTLLLELSKINDTTWVMPSENANCVDRSDEEVEPVVSFTPGVEGEIMFMRACIIIDPVFPASGFGAQLPLDESGGYRMTAISAFSNEPQ